MVAREREYDVVIVGGGPAGLSAALLLARCLRSAVVVDAGEPRNQSSRALYGFLTRDGTHPLEFLATARAELERYRVQLVSSWATRATPEGSGFRVTLATSAELRGRRLLLAGGVEDVKPELEGFDELFGTTAFPCPFCDGFEFRGRRIAVYSPLPEAGAFALVLRDFSADVVLFTDGHELEPVAAQRLAEAGVQVELGRGRALEGRGGELSAVVLADGREIARDVLFFKAGCRLVSPLGTGLGCALDERGLIAADPDGATNVPGVYVAGDASPHPKLAIVAAAEGAQAALAIHSSLRASSGRTL